MENAQKPPITVEKQYELKFKTWMENVRPIVIGGDGTRHKFVIKNVTPLGPGFSFKYMDVTAGENVLLVKYKPPENGIVPKESKVVMQILHSKRKQPWTFDMILKFDQDQAPEWEDSEIGAPTDCQICFSRFNKTSNVPKIFGCGHTFCSECLYKSQFESTSLEFSCPLDRLFKSKFPDKLPTNRSLLDLMEEADNKLAKKGPITSCIEDDEHQPEVYCETCSEAFCKICFAKLHSFKTMKNHTSVKMGEICSKHRTTAKFICSDRSHESWRKSFCDFCRKDGTHDNHIYDTFEGYEAKRTKQLEELLDKIGAREKHACGQLELFNEYYLTFDEDGIEMKNARHECERNFGEKMWKTLSDLANRKKQHLIEEKKKFEKVLSDAEKYKEEVKTVMEKKYDTTDIKMQLPNAYSFADQNPEELHPLSHYIFTAATPQSGSGNKRNMEKEDEREAKIPRNDNKIV